MNEVETIIARASGAAYDGSDPRWTRAVAVARAILFALDKAGFAVVPKEPTDLMTDAAIDEAGWRTVPYTAPRESGVAIDSDISEEDAVALNIAAKDAMASTYRAMIGAAK